MKQKTLIIIKPDAVKRNLLGEIIQRYEKSGLRIIAMKMLRVSKAFVARHYPEREDYILSIGEKSKKAGDPLAAKNPRKYGLMVVKALRAFMASGPVIAIVLEGEDAIQKARGITGYTDPSAADKGTIRGDFGEDSILVANRERRHVRNLVHASGTPEEAKKELTLWFGKKFT